MKHIGIGIFAALMLIGVSVTVATQSQSYDVIIRNGRVLDGMGNPAIFADVGIRGDTIVSIADLKNASATRVIDATGQYVTPGFFALHEHVDVDVLKGNGTLPNFSTQGFTTAVTNIDGRTAMWPISKQSVEFAKQGSALNLVQMVGHGTVRGMVMGTDYMRQATQAEIEKMKQLVRQGMEDGAFGLSTGLEYVPMRWSTEEEVLELAKAVAPYGGHYQAHLRSQGQYPKWQLPSSASKATTYIDSNVYTNIDAVVETINIAKYAGIPAMMDHLHPKGPREWGSSRIITQLVDKAWSDGYQVYINHHSYEAYDENIVLIPRWAMLPKLIKGLGQYDSSNPEADYTNLRGLLQQRLADPEQARVIRRDIAYDMDRQGGPDGLLIMDFPDRSLIGKTIGQVAKQRKEDPIDTALFLQMTGFNRPGGVQLRAFAVSLLDIEQFMRQDYTGVCTDRRGDSPELRKDTFAHPGIFGTVPRRIRTFVFDKKVTTLPFAIRSLTSLSAQILGLRDRGRLAEGLKADVVVFDPETIRDKATYFEPFQYSEGINYVLVNGRLIVDKGKPTAERPGKVLQRQRVVVKSGTAMLLRQPPAGERIGSGPVPEDASRRRPLP